MSTAGARYISVIQVLNRSAYLPVLIPAFPVKFGLKNFYALFMPVLSTEMFRNRPKRPIKHLDDL